MGAADYQQGRLDERREIEARLSRCGGWPMQSIECLYGLVRVTTQDRTRMMFSPVLPFSPSTQEVTGIHVPIGQTVDADGERLHHLAVVGYEGPGHYRSRAGMPSWIAVMQELTDGRDHLSGRYERSDCSDVAAMREIALALGMTPDQCQAAVIAKVKALKAGRG